MFTPVTYFTPPAAGGFDPSLGGSLDVLYHWDYTDSSTMTLSGTDVTAIADKISSETLTSYYTDHPQLKDGYVEMGNGVVSGLRSGVNDMPAGMFSNNTFTITVYAQVPVGSPGLANLQSNQTNGWRGATYFGYRESMPGSWTPELCDNHGSGTNVMWRYYAPGVANESKHSTITTTQKAKKSLVGLGYDTSDGYLMYDNGTEETYCSKFWTNSTDSGNGFYHAIGSDATANYYHVVVHSELISSTNMNDLYDAFMATQE